MSGAPGPPSAAALPATPTERPSFEEVYGQWFDKVYRWIRAMGVPSSEVDDVTQEVFVVVQRKLSSFDGRHLPAWLYRIAANVASDTRRRAWFRHLFLRSRDVPLDELVDRTESSAELLEQKEARQTLRRIIAKMNPKWRAAFVLFEVEGYSGEEIAALQGLPVATVWTHVHRARKEFMVLVAAHQRGAARWNG